MSRPTAIHGPTHGRKSKRAGAAGAVIRIGTGGALAGEAHQRAFWLTLEEAEALALDLAAAIRTAKAYRPTGLPPEPPLANAAALEAA